MQKTLFFIAGLIASLSAHAATLVDTGPGPATAGGAAIYSDQWLASEFTLSNPSVVTGVEGWIGVYNPGVLTLSIYSDGGDLPGSLLYTTSVAYGVTATAWLGVASGLNWLLPAGSYWVAYSGTNDGFAYAPSPSVTPLNQEAAYHSSGGWISTDSINIGVRISGETQSTSVPDGGATLALLGLSLSGVAWIRRKVGA